MVRFLGGIGEAFADRNFRIYSIGSVTSWITYFVQNVAFSWTAWEITQSTAWLAGIYLLTTLATLIFLPLGGVFADRHDRFKLVQLAYACDCLKALALAILAFTGHLGLGALCIAAFLHGVIHSFSVPAAYGMLPRFVARERLASAIAVNAAYSQFAIFAGPALAGWILVHWGAATAFAVNVAGYLVYFVAAARLQTPGDYRQARATRHPIAKEVTAGVRYLFDHPGLSAFMALILIGDAIAAATYQMMPAYADLVLGKGVGTVSLLYGAAGIGATLAAVWLAQGGAKRATPQRVLWAFLGFTIAVYALAGSPFLVLSVTAMLLYGFSGETRRTVTVSIMQSSVEDTQRGRVMATQHFLTQVAGGLGTLGIGVAAHSIGLRLPMALAAVVLSLTWLIVFTRRRRIAAAFAERVTSSS